MGDEKPTSAAPVGMVWEEVHRLRRDLAEVRALRAQDREQIEALCIEQERLRQELAEARAVAATCSCGNSPMTYEGPEPDCPVHGAVRAFNEASAEIERLREHERIRAQVIADHQGRLIAADAVLRERDRLAKVIEVVGLIGEHYRPRYAGPSWESRRDELVESLVLAWRRARPADTPGELVPGEADEPQPADAQEGTGL